MKMGSDGSSRRPSKVVIAVALAALTFGAVYVLTIVTRSPFAVTATDEAPSTVGETRPPGQSNAVGVQVLKPERRDLIYSVRLPATLSPIAQVTIYAKVSGYLKSIYVDKGDTVRAGQLLAVIDNPELGQKFQQAKSDYALKKLTYDRLANVRKENADVIAQQDVDVSEGAYLRAKHALEELQSTLAYTNVRAPFGGVITARFVDAGALVQAATSSATQALPLLTLMNMSTIRVYANVSQNDAALVKPGIPSFVSIAQLPGRRFEGTVTRTTGALDPTTRTMLVEMHLPNKDGMLQPGMFAEAVLQLKRHPNALALPPAALVLDSMGTAVFVVEGDKAKKVPIRTGIDDGVWVEVVEGLTGGENVVVVGKSRLTDGTAVAASPYNIPPGKSASQQF